MYIRLHRAGSGSRPYTATSDSASILEWRPRIRGKQGWDRGSGLERVSQECLSDAARSRHHAPKSRYVPAIAANAPLLPIRLLGLLLASRLPWHAVRCTCGTIKHSLTRSLCQCSPSCHSGVARDHPPPASHDRVPRATTSSECQATTTTSPLNPPAPNSMHQALSRPTHPHHPQGQEEIPKPGR